MKKLDKARCNNHFEIKQMAFYDNGEAVTHPTLIEMKIWDINHQIDILYEQLNIIANEYCFHDISRQIQRSKEIPITMNISLMYEELSRFYESIGQLKEALGSLVLASQGLFEHHCDWLNSLMGYGQPHEARLYELDNRCKELCHQHPELWEQYRNSIMKYLLANQHHWPCE